MSVYQIHLREIDSTQAEAKRQLGKTLAPFCVRADMQTAGRGRSGQPWICHAGNYYATFVWPWQEIATAPKLSYAAAYALYRFLISHGVTDIAVKWPNDVLIGNKKIAGILLEHINGHVCIGIGVNLVNAPVQDEIAPRSFEPTSLAEFDIGVEEFHQGLEIALSEEIEKFRTYGFEPLRRALDGCLWVRSELVYEDGNSKELVRVIGITPDGALEVEGATGRRKVVAGDLYTT